MNIQSFYRPLCLYCKHLDINGGQRRCTAFQDGIPDEIWHLAFDHREPYPDDNGIRFELIDDFTPLWESDVYEIKPDSLDDFEREQQELLKKSIHNIELRRKYGTSEPRITEDSEKYQPRNHAELRLIINYRVNRTVYDFEQTLLQDKGVYLDPFERIKLEVKECIKIEREYVSLEEEVKYVEQNFVNLTNQNRILANLVLLVEAYREIGEEHRLIEIYEQIGKIDQLKSAYKELNLDFPNK